MLRYLSVLLAALSLVGLQGCASHHQLGDYLDRQDPAAALAKLESKKPLKQNRALYLLNRGLLHHLVGNYQLSNKDLEATKQVLARVQAVSISEGVASATLNRTFNDYSATPSERVLVHLIKALNYLALNDLSGARVEALQADLAVRTEQNELAELASMRFLAGMIFELNGEWSDAMISYRKAEQALSQQQRAIPSLLQQRLLMGSQLLGLDAEYQAYLERFGQSEDEPRVDSGEVLVVYLKGRVPTMEQRRVIVYAPSLEHNVTLAQAYYPPRRVMSPKGRFDLGADQVDLELIEDLDELARQSLEQSRAKRLALNLARVSAKHQLVKNAREQDPLLGSLADLASILSESADTRSWDLLPAIIQVGRLELPAGQYSADGNLAAPLVIKRGSVNLIIANSYQYSVLGSFN